jgi:hypothetical protein
MWMGIITQSDEYVSRKQEYIESNRGKVDPDGDTSSRYEINKRTENWRGEHQHFVVRRVPQRKLYILILVILK